MATASSFGDGTHLVPDEIRPGVYRAGDANGGYWARLRGLDGVDADIIANDVVVGTEALVTIHPTDRAFKSEGCGTWVLVSEAEGSNITPSDHPIEQRSPTSSGSNTAPQRSHSRRMLIACSACDTVAGESSPTAEPSSVWSAFLRHWSTHQERGDGHSGVATGTAIAG